jgi:hypothetical protein
MAAAADWERIIELSHHICSILLPQHVATKLEFSLTNIAIWTKEASSDIGYNVRYDDNMISNLNLSKFSAEDYARNDLALSTQNLDDILQQAIKPLRFKGLSAPALRELFKPLRSRHTIVDILGTGARRFMRESFAPNGGHESSLAGSYSKMIPICNHTLLELVREGRAIAFSKDALIQWVQCQISTSAPWCGHPRLER